jgi:hypothetical protein
MITKALDLARQTKQAWATGRSDGLTIGY